MIEMCESVRESITKDELLPAVSLVVTVGFIIIGGYVMSYLVKMEEESVQRQLGAKGTLLKLAIKKENNFANKVFNFSSFILFQA